MDDLPAGVEEQEASTAAEEIRTVLSRVAKEVFIGGVPLGY